MGTRGAFRRILIIGATLFTVLPSQGADFPAKPITFVVPFSPGSAVDAYARLVAPRLSEALGQPVLVDNREGAGGMIGAQTVLRAPADGYTYLFALPPWEYTPYFFKNPPYIPLKDFRAVARLGFSPLVIMAAPDAPFSDLPGLITYARKNPGKLTYASSGSGSASHLLAEQFKNAAQLDILHVPYKSTAQANTDVIGGQISLSFSNLSIGLPFIKAQKVKGIAVTSLARSKLAPDLPTVAESGLPGFEGSQWFGLVARAGTPAEAADRMHREIGKLLTDPEIAARFEAMGTQLTPTTQQDFTSYIAADIDKWVKLGKQLRITYE